MEKCDANTRSHNVAAANPQHVSIRAATNPTWRKSEYCPCSGRRSILTSASPTTTRQTSKPAQAIKSGRLVDASQFSQQIRLGSHLGSPQIDFDSDVYGFTAKAICGLHKLPRLLSRQCREANGHRDLEAPGVGTIVPSSGDSCAGSHPDNATISSTVSRPPSIGRL